jgi:F0F1-type ATP synthase epsilon subunit
MNLKILGPTTKKTITVEWIDVQTTEGSMVILPGHAPLTLQLAHNTPVSLGLPGGAVNSIPIADGILAVDRHQATIILDD